MMPIEARRSWQETHLSLSGDNAVAAITSSIIKIERNLFKFRVKFSGSRDSEQGEEAEEGIHLEDIGRKN